MFRFRHQNIRCGKLLGTIAQISAILAMANIWEGSMAYNLDMQFPLVYEDPTENAGRGTYFGYSVILYSSQGKNNTAWIQIGAPRANSSFKQHDRIREPGVVYRCSFWPAQPCKPMRLDRKGNEPYIGDGISYWDLKDGAWIGGAMAVQPGPGGLVAICGPRWMNQLYKNTEKEFYQLGVCYWMPAEDDEAIQSGITKDDAEKILPLLNEDRVKYSHPSWNGANVYDFGVGEAGMSVHMPLTRERSELLLGSPGLLNWRGGTVLYRDGVSFIGGGLNKRSALIGAFSELTVPSTKALLRFSEFGYLGYQVSSGNFFEVNETLYVASAPRGMSFKGQVLLFTYNNFGPSKQSSYILKGRAVGIQIGEYFGTSLAVGDLNNDGLDDLIVGAPLYAARSSGSVIGYDEGRVSVYLGSNINRLIETQRIAGKIAGARFGSAVSYLGDLDSDGYAGSAEFLPEVAVGAPYEDQGRGAVYVFPGNKEFGLSNNAVQYLKAHDIYPYLRGFGSSISVHPADIDHNGCPDIAVGAYVSGHAVVFRGRPILRWEVISPHSVEHVPRNATVLTIEDVCITYSGNYAPNSIGVWRMMEVDPIHQRCQMKNSTAFSEMIHLTKDKSYCENKEIMLKPNIQNFLNPIDVNIWYQLPEEKDFQEIKAEKNNPELKIQPILIKRNVIIGEDNFCKDCPIPQGISRISISIPFEVECGKDNVCHSDLHVTGVLPQLSKSTGEKNISYTIGSTKILQLKLIVSNKETAELAYLTRLYIELGTPAKISQIPAVCREISQLPFLNTFSEFTKVSQKSSGNSSDNLFLPQNSSNTASSTQSLHRTKGALYISCELDNPLQPNYYREVLLGLDMTNAQGSEGMQLRAWTITSSNETNPFDNIWHLHLPFHSEADIAIAGTTDNDVYTFYKGNKESEGRINFTNIFEVEKFGPSPLEKVDIEFQIPVATKNKNDKLTPFLSIKKIESKQDEQSLTCRYFRRKISAASPSKKYFSSGNSTENSEVSISKKESSVNTTAISGIYKVQRNTTLYLSCSPFLRIEDHYVECITIKCDAGPFLNSMTSAQVFLHMELNAKALYPFMGARKTILIETSGFVKVKEPASIKQPILGKPDQALVSTLLVEEASKEQLESWVLAISIAGGMMVLLILATGLSKVGFFDRKKKDELKEFKRELLLGDESHTD